MHSLIYRFPERARSQRLGLRAIALIVLAGAIAFSPATAQAHDGSPIAPDDLESWRTWVPDPLTLVPLLVAVWLYFKGSNTREDRTNSRRGLKRVAFCTGLLGLGLVLASPLDALAESLFLAHMLQHLVIVAVSAPLLVLARPLPRFTRAVPESRRLLRWSHRYRWLRAASAALIALPVAIVVHEIALLAWHAPRLYEAALASELIHLLEHAFFFATALLFWAAVLRGFEAGSLRNAGAVTALFLVSLAGNAFGALFVFSETLWYEHYATTAPSWGLDPLLDQRLAGGLMWMIGGLFYLAAAVALLLNWLAALERRQSVGVPADSSQLDGGSRSARSTPERQSG